MGKGPIAALKEAPADESTEWLNFDHPCRGVNRAAPAGRVELLLPDGSAPRQKFALVGFSMTTRHYAPLNDPEWAVVGMNQLQRHLRHAVLDDDGNPLKDDDGNLITVLRHGDLWFEIHKEWNTALAPNTDHAGWLNACDMPVYMTDEVEGIPTSVKFPVDRLIEKFDIDYYTSTVAYMLVWVIDHIDHLVAQRLRKMPANGATPIDVIKLVESIYAEYTVGIYGIDLVVGGEYIDERPAAEFWIGQLLARNVKVIIPRESALLKQHYRYGYEMEREDLIRASDLENHRAELEQQHEKAKAEAIELYGRLHELKSLPDGEDAIAARLAELEAAHQKAAVFATQLDGALGENFHWTRLRELRERGGNL